MADEELNGEKLQQMRQLETAKKQILAKVLEREAYERLARVRIVNPELASHAELYLVQVHQSGKLRKKVTDVEMKAVLGVLSEKREIKIKRV